jgi:superfamily II DNA or RNA helicase
VNSSDDLFGQDIDFGYLNKSVNAPKKFHPELVLNSESSSMLRALRTEIRNATSFTFSVAFVSPRAIALLKQELLDFQGVGRIITSDYLGFNSPEAFAELLNLKRLGLDIRISQKNAFHPKGYVFQQPEGVTAILGSSNLTAGALASNHEWNIKVSALRESDLASQFTNLLDEELFSSAPLTQGWIDEYAHNYQAPQRTQNHKTGITKPAGLEQTEVITPNEMQLAALQAISTVREANKDRALIISATGTGKTILSALDVRAVNPKRMLFIAHREQILDRAIQEFQRVLQAPSSEFGKVSGSSRQENRKYVFATVQTLSQRHVLETIDPETFDYILVDEVHRAGAASFGRVLDHFRPKFLLGMTATPERSDGENIFEIFDYNVPFEIRLNTALELGMLSPFHYYGVADFTFEDGSSTSDVTPLTRLVAGDRVQHIISAIETYGQAGIKPRGLIFCSRKDEARELSRELNNSRLHGELLRTLALTGEDSIESREEAVERLERGELDYLLTVDIFNEGVDIPSLNQVIMLRQTQSSIVFVQQLGRGLRKVDGKEYLVVIDFIGNYANNFLIPIALFGDESLNKESLRKNLIAAEEAGVISGLSSVSFDRIAQKRVLQALTTVKLDSLQNLKSAIETVRNRVGRIPLLEDFLKFESVDPVVLATKEGSYPQLLQKLKIQEQLLQETELSALGIVSKEYLTAKRPHELLLLKHFLGTGSITAQEAKLVLSGAGIENSSDQVIESALRSLSLEFNTASEVAAFKSEAPAVQLKPGVFELSKTFAEAYENSLEFKVYLDDLIRTGLLINFDRYRVDVPFTAGRQYSRKDVSRLLNWQKNMYSTIYGYRLDPETNSCPLFVTLEKSEEVSASTAYGDALVDPQHMLWFTKSNRTLASKVESDIANNQVEIYVFAKKNDAEGSGHYFLGKAKASNAENTTMPDVNGKPIPVVKMHLRFDEPVQTGLFDYFSSKP